jgi:hypothetical protein
MTVHGPATVCSRYTSAAGEGATTGSSLGDHALAAAMVSVSALRIPNARLAPACVMTILPLPPPSRVASYRRERRPVTHLSGEVYG